MEPIEVLVISGGGIQGCYGLGALHYLYENKRLAITTQYIGTSIGAILCYLLSIGYSPCEILKEVANFPLKETMNPNFQRLLDTKTLGVFDFSHIEKLLERLTIRKVGMLPTMRDLPRTTFVTFDLTAEKTLYLNIETAPNLPALYALRMSCAVPLLFPRVEYQSFTSSEIHEYIDGGASDNLAISYAESKYPNSKVHAIYLRRVNDSTYKNSLIAYLTKMLQLTSRLNVLNQIREKKITTTVYDMACKQPPFDFELSRSARIKMFVDGYKTMKSF